ncbi:MAG: hypothetical protein KBB86_01855 [Candidatus Pacebacteria bacterium]|nr:hypothetical protein [Candidatus Paceibacterota bacterium]
MENEDKKMREFSHEKSKQILRLCSFSSTIDSDVKFLNGYLEAQKAMLKSLNELIGTRSKQIRQGVYDVLIGRIFEESQEDLKKISSICFTEDQKLNQLIPFILETSFHIKMDINNEVYALAGTGFTPLIKMDDIYRRSIANTHEEVKQLLIRVSEYWKGVAEINYVSEDCPVDTFRVGWNIAGLIHENAKSLQS